jgi:predicted nucleic acid-binding protein
MSLVIDASVLVEVLLDSPVGRRARSVLDAHEPGLHIPELAVVEVVSVLRGLVRGEVVAEARAARVLTALRTFPAHRWPLDALSSRAWGLRHALSAYDAVYVALAEALGATLLTMDARLARGAEPVARCPIALAV